MIISKSSTIPNFFIEPIKALFNSLILAKNASFIRVVCYAFLLFSNLKYPNVEFSKLDIFFWSPTGLANYLTFIRPPFSAFEILDAVWNVSLLTSALGLFSKLSKTIAFFGWLIVGAYDQHFGYVTFSGFPLTFLLIYSIFLEDTYFSLDRAFFKKKNKILKVQAWPIICFQIFFISCYVIAAIQKIRLGAGYWSSGNEYVHIIEENTHRELPLYVGTLSSIGVLFLELTTPLLFNKKCVYLYVILLVSFHYLNKLALGITADFWVMSLLLFLFTKNKFDPNSNKEL